MPNNTSPDLMRDPLKVFRIQPTIKEDTAKLQKETVKQITDLEIELGTVPIENLLIALENSPEKSKQELAELTRKEISDTLEIELSRFGWLRENEFVLNFIKNIEFESSITMKKEEKGIEDNDETGLNHIDKIVINLTNVHKEIVKGDRNNFGGIMDITLLEKEFQDPIYKFIEIIETRLNSKNYSLDFSHLLFQNYFKILKKEHLLRDQFVLIPTKLKEEKESLIEKIKKQSKIISPIILKICKEISSELDNSRKETESKIYPSLKAVNFG